MARLADTPEPPYYAVIFTSLDNQADAAWQKPASSNT